MNDAPIMTTAEVAVYLRVSKAHLSRMLNGKCPGVPPLPAYRLGRRILVRRTDLDDWLVSLLAFRQDFE